MIRLRLGADAVPTEDVLHRLIRQPMPEIGKRSDDPIVAPPDFSRAMRTTIASTSEETGQDTVVAWNHQTSERPASDTRLGWCPVWRRKGSPEEPSAPDVCQFRRA